jgi:clan AA aspartic protease (TIGR02281 family)
MNYRMILITAAIAATTMPAFAAAKHGWWGVTSDTHKCQAMGITPAEVVRNYRGKIVHQDAIGTDIEVTLDHGQKHELTMYPTRGNCEQDLASASTPTTPTASAPAPDQKLEPATANDVKEIYIAPDNFGSFSTALNINGVTELGTIDTGADRVALTAETAARLGLHLSDKDYTDRYSTANGVAYSAPVTLNHLQIGSFVFDNVPAEVAKPGAQDTNLIGMSLLKICDLNCGMAPWCSAGTVDPRSKRGFHPRVGACDAL